LNPSIIIRRMRNYMAAENSMVRKVTDEFKF
jgi:hypothetical protein